MDSQNEVLLRHPVFEQILVWCSFQYFFLCQSSLYSWNIGCQDFKLDDSFKEHTVKIQYTLSACNQGTPMKHMILNHWHHCLYSTVYWDAMPCSLVDGYQCFRRKHLHLQGRSTLRRKAASSLETAGNELPDASCHMTQDSNFYGPHQHNLKSHTATHKHLMQTYLQATPRCFWNNTVSSRPGMSFKFNSSLQKHQTLLQMFHCYFISMDKGSTGTLTSKYYYSISASCILNISLQLSFHNALSH